MKKIILSLILIFFPFFLQAQSVPHVVISEIKITGGTGKTTDEFVEIYNPTEQNISLTGWGLYKQTSSGTEYVLVDDFGTSEIKSFGYLLITHPGGYQGGVLADITYSSANSISSNNTIFLRDNNGLVIDLVGMGTASYFETEATVNPGSNKSIERKAESNSDEDTMSDGESDYWRGNSFDSDNNKIDFINKDIPEPQNSLAELEYLDKVAISEEDLIARVSDNIIITELFPNPLGIDNDEFIELYNGGKAAVNLFDWQVGDNSTNKFKITNDDFTNLIINPGEYLVIEKELSGISLNNTVDTVFLYDYQGKLVDSIEYLDCQTGMSYILVADHWIWTDDITPGQANNKLINNTAPQAIFDLADDIFMVGQSISLDASQSFDEDGDVLEYQWEINEKKYQEGKIEYQFDQVGNFQIKLTVNDEWGESDSQVADVSIIDYDYSDKIFLTEVLPDCTGPDEECEFIELYNAGEQEINLKGWSLTDTKKTYRLESDTLIDSQDYLVVYRPQSKITLNNASDVVYLLDPKGDIINGVEYQNAKSDFSFSLVDNSWQWTDLPTPGEKNIIKNELVEIEGELESSQLPVELSIKDVTEEYLDRIIIVSGEVESAKKTGIYLMDEAGHTIRIYIQEKTGIPWPEVSPGNWMRVTGLLDKTSAGLRLLPQKAEDIIITKTVIADGKSVDPLVLGDSTDKQIIDITKTNSTQSVARYLYIIIGFLLVVTVGITIKYFFTKKQEKSVEEDIY